MLMHAHEQLSILCQLPAVAAFSSVVLAPITQSHARGLLRHSPMLRDGGQSPKDLRQGPLGREMLRTYGN